MNIYFCTDFKSKRKLNGWCQKTHSIGLLVLVLEFKFLYAARQTYLTVRLRVSWHLKFVNGSVSMLQFKEPFQWCYMKMKLGYYEIRIIPLPVDIPTFIFKLAYISVKGCCPFIQVQRNNGCIIKLKLWWIKVYLLVRAHLNFDSCMRFAFFINYGDSLQALYYLVCFNYPWAQSQVLPHSHIQTSITFRMFYCLHDKEKFDMEYVSFLVVYAIIAHQWRTRIYVR